MLEMGLTPATVVIAALVLLWAVWAGAPAARVVACATVTTTMVAAAKGRAGGLGCSGCSGCGRGRSHGGRNGPSPAGERTGLPPMTALPMGRTL